MCWTNKKELSPVENPFSIPTQCTNSSFYCHILDNFLPYRIMNPKGCEPHGCTFERWQGNGPDDQGRSEAHRWLLPLPSGANRGKQVHLQGIPGADGWPQFQGFLPLYAVCERLKIFWKNAKKLLTNFASYVSIFKRWATAQRVENRDGRVVELVDSLDSGSSVHCGRAGSSPASPTRETVERLSLFLLVHPLQSRCVSLLWMKKEYFPYSSPPLWSLHLFASIAIYFAVAPSVWILLRKVLHFPILDYPCEICKSIL